MQQPSFKTLPCCASRLAGRAEDSRVSLICVKLESADQIGGPQQAQVPDCSRDKRFIEKFDSLN